MAESTSQIYQFRVDLKNFKPPIWRRIQVPADFTFEKLHLAIQCAFGWANKKRYVFIMGYNLVPHKNSQYFPKGLPERDYLTKEYIEIGIPINDRAFYSCPDLPNDPVPISSLATKLPEYFKKVKSKGQYNYEIGYPWRHIILLEKILPRVEGQTYPQCTGGRMATPPEDEPPYVYSDCEEEVEEPDPTIFDYKAVKFDRFF